MQKKSTESRKLKINKGGLGLFQRVSRLSEGTKVNVDEPSPIPFILCRKFKWTYQELMETPIPFVWNMVAGICNEIYEEYKSMKKSKRK